MGDFLHLINPIARILGRGNGTSRTAHQIRFITGAICPPFTFYDANGRLVGLQIDLAEALCAELRAVCKFVPRRHEQIFKSLLAGEGDAIIAGLEPTAARREIVAFTNPFMSDHPRFMVRKGFDRTITREGLRGLRIGTLADTQEEYYLRKFFEDPAIIVPLAGRSNVLGDALIAGTVDLSYGTVFCLYEFLGSPLGRGLQLVDQAIPSTIPLCIALRKEDHDLLGRLNGALAQLRADGRLAAIRSKWTPISL